MSAVDDPDAVELATVAPPPPRCRPFRLADAMVLIAAAALVCLYLRVIMPIIGTTFDFAQRNGLWSTLTTRRGLFFLVPLLGIYTVTLLCLTPAYLVVRLLPPRPPLREVAGQPGVVAVGAIVFASIITLTLRTSWFTLVLGVLAIPVAWSVLAVRGRWRTESGWIDAFGKAIGVGWCLLPWVGLAVPWLSGAFDPGLKRPWF